MNDRAITAALVVIGFTLPLGVAWHRGVFQAGNDEPVVNSAPVHLTGSVPVLPAAALPPVEPLPTNEPSAQVDASVPDAGDEGPLDPITSESREIVRANRQH